MDKNTEFLNYIYQNTKMGIETTAHVMESTDNKEIREHLQQQINEYTKLNEQAQQLLNKSGHEEKDISSMQKVTAYISIGAKTMVDNSPEHITEMMMQGNSMGIIDITKNLKKYDTASPEIRSLGEALLKKEEGSYAQWQKYLSMVAN